MTKLIDKSAVVAEIKRRDKLVSDPILLNNDLMIGEHHAYFHLLPFLDTLQEQEVDLEKDTKAKSIWHDASGEPTDKAHCLVNYGGSKYVDFELVLYNMRDKCFITNSYPHPTGDKVEKQGSEGIVVAEVYKGRRDRIPITDVVKWAYLSDILQKED